MRRPPETRHSRAVSGLRARSSPRGRCTENGGTLARCTALRSVTRRRPMRQSGRTGDLRTPGVHDPDPTRSTKPKVSSPWSRAIRWAQAQDPVGPCPFVSSVRHETLRQPARKRCANHHENAAPTGTGPRLRPGERSGTKSSLFVILRRRGVLSPVPLGIAGRFERWSDVVRHAIHDLVEGIDDRRRTA